MSRRPSRTAADFQVDPEALAAVLAGQQSGDVWEEPLGNDALNETELLLEELGFEPRVPPALRTGYSFFPHDDDEFERITPRCLQRGDVEKAPPRTTSRASSNGRRKNTAVPIRMPRQRVEDEREIERVHTPRFRVYGLTRGEAEFYHARSGFARQVSVHHVAMVLAEKYVTAFDLPRGSSRLNFEVYGLRKLEIDVLRTAPGSARAALAQYARQHDASRIALRDRSS